MQTIKREDVFEFLAKLPADKLAEVYDFARFIAEQRAAEIIVDARSDEQALTHRANAFEI